MTGVEILSTAEVAVVFGFCWVGFIWLIIAGIVYGFLTVFAGDNLPLAVFVFMFVLAIAFIIGFVGEGEPTAYETQYKVTVSDEVSMNEFLARYEIIDQEGKVYTVRQRDDYVEPETEEPTGHWGSWQDAYCSECNQFCPLAYSGNYSKYCPNCGIKMEPKESVNKNEKIN